MTLIHTWLQPRRPGGAMRHRRQPALLALLLLLTVALAGCGAESTNPAGGVKATTEAAIARALPTEEPGGTTPRLTGNGGGRSEATGVETDSLESCDRAALVALYLATGGTNWWYSRGWLSDEPIGHWEDVHTSNGRVTELRLYGNRLNGEIPPELGNLVNLKMLDLWDNQLSGEIPAELGNLAEVYLLSLANNQLTGEIPPELGKSENLEYLDLEDNRLSGEIPPELGKARELRLLWFSENEMSGVIPPELANRRHLDLSGSATGCIPQGLRNVRNDRPPDEPRIVVVDRTSDTAKLSVEDFEDPISRSLSATSGAGAMMENPGRSISSSPILQPVNTWTVAWTQILPTITPPMPATPVVVPILPFPPPA